MAQVGQDTTTIPANEDIINQKALPEKNGIKITEV